MNTVLPILAQPLAPDCAWLALLFLAALACLRRPGTLTGRLAGHHHPHGIAHRLHDLMAHRHP